MKKLSFLFALLCVSHSLFAYKHTIYNYTKETVQLKINQLWCPDQDLEIEPAQEEDGQIKPSKREVYTSLWGLACTKAIEAHCATGTAIATLTGLCLVPYCTEKSKNLEIHISYRFSEREKDTLKGKGLKVEVR